MSQKDKEKMKRQAQSTLEYTVFIVIIVAALIAMQVYIKRGMQGRIRGYAQEIGEGSGYSPGATYANSTIVRIVDEHAESYTEDSGNKTSISETEVNMSQVTSREEAVASFAEEP